MLSPRCPIRKPFRWVDGTSSSITSSSLVACTSVLRPKNDNRSSRYFLAYWMASSIVLLPPFFACWFFASLFLSWYGNNFGLNGFFLSVNSRLLDRRLHFGGVFAQDNTLLHKGYQSTHQPIQAEG